MRCWTGEGVMSDSGRVLRVCEVLVESTEVNERLIGRVGVVSIIEIEL